MSGSKKKSSQKFKINYIRKRIPRFDVPVYTGKRYDDMVPDTLDIQERAALLINGLTGPTDPEKDYLPYFFVNFRANPPSMTHGQSDVCLPKFMEALTLMRLVSGSSLNDCVDPVWMATGLRTIGRDGLFYWPAFPWAPNVDWSGTTGARASHYSIVCFTGIHIAALTAYFLRDPSGPWRRELEKVVNGLWSIAIEKDDFAYFPEGAVYPDQPRDKNAPMPLAILASLVGWTIRGLAKHHMATGYEPSIELAEKLSRYLAYHSRFYRPNGEFMPNTVEDVAMAANADKSHLPGEDHLIHFPHHVIPLMGMLDHAVAVGNRPLCEFVCKAYEHAKTKGNTEIGYFPENAGDIHMFFASELCEVAGMICLALKLSAAGLGDYWDDADRWIRNMFAEGQLRRTDWVYRMHMGGLINYKTTIPPSAIDLVKETCDRVPERNIGAFAGWPTANDWYAGYCYGIQHCCTGNGARAMYSIWQNMISYDRGTLSVNLLMNRPSEWADIKSHIPYEGRVDVSVKKSCSLRLRIPEWVAPRQVACTVNARKRKVRFDGRYAPVGKVKAGDEVSMTFPIWERTVKENIEKQHYILIKRGNEVVNIDPPGRFCPLYQRDHYRENVTRWRKVSRFVSNERLYW